MVLCSLLPTQPSSIDHEQGHWNTYAAGIDDRQHRPSCHHAFVSVLSAKTWASEFVIESTGQVACWGGRLNIKYCEHARMDSRGNSYDTSLYILQCQESTVSSPVPLQVALPASFHIAPACCTKRIYNADNTGSTVLRALCRLYLTQEQARTASRSLLSFFDSIKRRDPSIRAKRTERFRRANSFESRVCAKNNSVNVKP